MLGRSDKNLCTLAQDLATTNTYLDSFGSSVINEAVKVL
jgi:hypothetical protein